MEIERLKMICIDEQEASYASFVYSKSVKFGEPFTIDVQTYRGDYVSQEYDKFGNPIGKPVRMVI